MGEYADLAVDMAMLVEMDEEEPRSKNMKPKKAVWKDRQGKYYTINDITDSHLINIIKMVKRNVPEPAGGFDVDSMACYYAEQAFDSAIDNWHNTIDYFEAEAKKRKLSLDNGSKMGLSVR